MTSQIRLFTCVTEANVKSVVANPDEPADPEGGGGFAEWVMITVYALHIVMAESYRVSVDLFSEIPGVMKSSDSPDFLTTQCFSCGLSGF